MLEFLILFPAIWAIVARARQRRVNETWFAIAPLIGWMVGWGLQVIGLPPIAALVARWAPLVGSFIAVEFIRPSPASMDWQCPECRAFNEPTALTCVCRRVRPDLRP